MQGHYKTSGGLEVTVTPMLAYPDGMLLAADLLGRAFPAIGALPPGTLDLIKTALVEGSSEQAARLALMSMITSDPSAGAPAA
ncbi:MAG: hypothetical protein ACRCU1_18400, partial [Alsobacter sp.]